VVPEPIKDPAFQREFCTSYKREAEVNRLSEQDNPLFLWFTHEMLTRELELSNDDDALRTARAVLLEFYRESKVSASGLDPEAVHRISSSNCS